MDYKQWADFFGRTTDDSKLRNVLSNAGITKPPKVGKDDTDVRVDLKDKGITLVFSDPAFFHQRDDRAIGEDAPFLSGVILMLQHPKAALYKGPLPFELEKDTSQGVLRARYGSPLKKNDDFRWDQWKIDDLLLTATYAKDLKSLARVGVGLSGQRN